MKKFAKMSLVAALAVTGTVATAQPLAEAIKNVDVSGTVVYRYNDYNADNPDNGQNQKANYYKAVMNLKSKVNDDVTANVSVSANNNMGAWDTRSKGDSNVDVELTKVNFAYTGVKNTTVVLGKQGIPTPWTMASDSDGAEQTGTGVLALSTWGPVTFAGAYFNQQNFNESGPLVNKGGTLDILTDDYIDGAEDVATVGIMANIGPVALDAWYLSFEDDNINVGTTDISFDSYTVGAKYGLTLGEVKLGFDARYTNLDFDKAATNNLVNGKTANNSTSNLSETENELWKIGVSAKMGIFAADVLYAQTGEDGGLAAIDGSAKTAVENWNVSLNGQRDTTLIKYKVSAQVLPELNIALQYNDRDSDVDADGNDAEELYTQITYNMSKNFSAYVRLGQYKQTDENGKEEDSDAGRLQIQYSF